MPVNHLEAAEAESAAAWGDEKRAYVRRIFSEIAPRYDVLNRVLSFNVDRRWRRRAIAALDWTRRPDGRYLDLCAGTLDVAAELARTPGFHGTVVGADFAEPMLRAGAGKARHDVVSPVVADALELPFAASSMAGAIVAFGIRNLADLDAGFREVLRVLEPGGRFVILEFSTPSSAVVRAGYHAYFHHVLPLVGRMVSGHETAYRYLPQSVASFPSPRALGARVERAGFLPVRWNALTFGIAALHVGEKAGTSSAPASS